MTLQNIFINNFELIIPEFFLITILLTLLLYGVFYKKKNNQIFLITKNINTIIMYLLLIILLLIRQDRDLGPFDAERARQVDGVLADVDLVFQGWSNADRGVGDDQDAVGAVVF